MAYLSGSDMMGAFSAIGAPRTKYDAMGSIPKDHSAYKILQSPTYKDMGDVSWTTGETWGILFEWGRRRHNCADTVQPNVQVRE